MDLDVMHVNDAASTQSPIPDQVEQTAPMSLILVTKSPSRVVIDVHVEMINRTVDIEVGKGNPCKAKFGKPR